MYVLILLDVQHRRLNRYVIRIFLVYTYFTNYINLIATLKATLKFPSSKNYYII